MRFAICFGALILSACVQKTIKPEIISSKVTVTTSGKEVSDFDSQFVRRVELTPSQLERISKFDQVQDSFDQFGSCVGLQLLGEVPALALQKGDILTAIGKKVLKPGDRLSILKGEIAKGETSITFLRVGRVYKTLIAVR